MTPTSWKTKNRGNLTKVGGIHANNTYPAEFIYQNLMVQANVIDAAFRSGVQKLLFLGSSCIYPKLAPQPMAEDALLTGPLEPTNEPYAIAKIAGIKLCESYNRQYRVSHGVDYRSIMPTNLYGPGDNYHPENSHVIPALIRRFHEAKVANAPTVTVWGSGTPRREFLYVDDMAAASAFVMGGLGACVAEEVALHRPLPVCRIGIEDRFSVYCGTWDYLLQEHRLDLPSVKHRIESFLAALPEKTVDTHNSL